MGRHPIAEHFYEISIEGPTGRTLGFVQGFLTARGEGGRLLDAYREGFDCESLRERIRELREAGADDGEPLPAETIGVVSRVVRGEQKDRLWELLDTLDPAERELLVLRGIEQQDNKVVAEILGETPNAVSLRYDRLLTRLRRQLTGTIFDRF